VADQGLTDGELAELLLKYRGGSYGGPTFEDMLIAENRMGQIAAAYFGEEEHQIQRRKYLPDLANSNPAGPSAPPPDYPDSDGIPGGPGTGSDYTQWIVDNYYIQGTSANSIAKYLDNPTSGPSFFKDLTAENLAGAYISTGSLWQLDRAVIPFLQEAAGGNIHPELFQETLKIVESYSSGIHDYANQQSMMLVGAGLLLPAALGTGGALVVAAAPAVMAGGTAAYSATTTFVYTNAARLTLASGVVGEGIAGVSLTTPVATAGAGAALIDIAGSANTKVLLQGVTDRAVTDLAANPSLARSLMSPGSYKHLVEGTQLAPASYGKAVERLTAQYIREDAALTSVFRYQSKPFKSTPDFLGIEGYNLRSLDITTANSIGVHAARSYGSYTEIVTHPGLPSNLVFPR
jgi:hypothetical protein